MSFSHLGLSDKILAAIDAAGYKTPTPIQEQGIPHVLVNGVFVVRDGVQTDERPGMVLARSVLSGR